MCMDDQALSGEQDMTIQAHIAALEKRRQSVEGQLVAALAHSSTDDLIIADLKRQKLHLKDEIARLQMDVAGDGLR